MKNTYDIVMDAEQNQLRGIPPAQKFQIMVYLSAMWTAIFCLAAGAWTWYGELLIGHVAVALGIVVTGLTFRNAAKQTED